MIQGETSDVEFNELQHVLASLCSRLETLECRTPNDRCLALPVYARKSLA